MACSDSIPEVVGEVDGLALAVRFAQQVFHRVISIALGEGRGKRDLTHVTERVVSEAGSPSAASAMRVSSFSVLYW